jgi:AraC-like DNA-binding protein
MRLYLRTETRAILTPPGGQLLCLHHEAAAPGLLARYVDRIRWGADDFPEAIVERVLPDGAVHLVFELGGHGGASAVGAGTAPQTIQLAGHHEQLSVQLRPGGVEALLGVPASALCGREVPLSELWGDDAEGVRERIARAPFRQRGAVLARALTDRLCRSETTLDRRASAAVRLVLARHGNLRVRELAATLGVSERRLEQVFRREIGMTPKMLCRVTRFRHAVDVRCADPTRTWSDLALECGYADQAHLVHEFQELAGATPGTLASFGFFQERATIAG